MDSSHGSKSIHTIIIMATNGHLQVSIKSGSNSNVSDAIVGQSYLILIKLLLLSLK